MRPVLAALLLVACGSQAPVGPAPLPAPTGRPPLLVAGPLSPRTASYAIEARLDDKTHRVRGRERLTWKNPGDVPVERLPFHLYMNAFKNEGSVYMRENPEHFGEVSIGEGEWGWIEVSSIKLGPGDGDELRPLATFGEDETTLAVPLPRPVARGETIELTIEFETQLPHAVSRTGYEGRFFMVGQWFPKIGVLQGSTWHCDSFHANAEFFSDFGVYHVSLTVPETLVVAATGVLTEVHPGGPGERVHVFDAEDVHDFAWMADPWMRVLEGTQGGVQVLVYHRPEQAAYAARHLEAARRTLATYGRLFGEYPYARISVIDPPPAAALSAGGMEYPTLVTTVGDVDVPGLLLLEQVTVHEVGHNWFQGMIASNEVDEPFLDEGVNEYANGLVLDEWLGEDRSVVDLPSLHVGYYPDHRIAANPADQVQPIVSRSYDFPSEGQYGATVYIKTTQVLRTLEGMVGRERFLAALGAYARRWAFKHPTTKDFLAALREGIGDEYEPFLQAAFFGLGQANLHVGPIHSHDVERLAGVTGEGAARKEVKPDGPDRGGDLVESEVVVSNLDRVPVAVDIDFYFSDGARERRRWDGAKTWQRFEFRRPAELVRVDVDPDGRVLLEHDLADNSLRVEARAGASWHAAASAGFWEQTLLLLVGP